MSTVKVKKEPRRKIKASLDNSSVRVKRETKRKIRVDFDRAPLWVRIKQRFFTFNFIKNVVFKIFRTVLLIGIAFVIVYPYISNVLKSVMTVDDFRDATVILLSKAPTFNQYWAIITENSYIKAFFTTLFVSLSVAFIQTLVCALVAYGLAKFKFKGNTIVFGLVIATLMIPQAAIKNAMMAFFKQITMVETTLNPVSFVLDIIQDWTGVFENGVGFSNSLIPLFVISLCGLGFKNGLFIFMLRQFFKGVPDELEESAFVDGSSTVRTFFSIIIPISIPMLVTVFIFAFSWQWTDNFYTGINGVFFDEKSTMVFMNSINKMPKSISDALQALGSEAGSITTQYGAAISGTASILIALPLIIMYVFLQRRIVEGVERSGIVG